MPIAIITGASRGLGFENAKGLAALGYDLVMVAKDQGRLSLAQQSLNALFPDRQISTYAVDLEDLAATREFNAGDTTGVLWEDNQIVDW